MDKLFFENLKEARLDAHMTQKEVAEKAKIAKSTYSQYESGKREPSIEVIKRLAHVLDVPADKLLGLPPTDFMGFLSAKDKYLLEIYHQLNDDGQRRLMQYVSELTDILRYRKKG